MPYCLRKGLRLATGDEDMCSRRAILRPIASAAEMSVELSTRSTGGAWRVSLRAWPTAAVPDSRCGRRGRAGARPRSCLHRNAVVLPVAVGIGTPVTDHVLIGDLSRESGGCVADGSAIVNRECAAARHSGDFRQVRGRETRRGRGRGRIRLQLRVAAYTCALASRACQADVRQAARLALSPPSETIRIARRGIARMAQMFHRHRYGVEQGRHPVRLRASPTGLHGAAIVRVIHQKFRPPLYTVTRKISSCGARFSQRACQHVPRTVPLRLHASAAVQNDGQRDGRLFVREETNGLLRVRCRVRENAPATDWSPAGRANPARRR